MQETLSKEYQLNCISQTYDFLALTGKFGHYDYSGKNKIEHKCKSEIDIQNYKFHQFYRMDIYNCDLQTHLHSFYNSIPIDVLHEPNITLPNSTMYLGRDGEDLYLKVVFNSSDGVSIDNYGKDKFTYKAMLHTISRRSLEKLRLFLREIVYDEVMKQILREITETRLKEMGIE